MLTTDEIKMLILNSDNPILALEIHLVFAGSLRKSEILALTWDDVDFQIGTISVSKTLKRVCRDAVDVLRDWKENLKPVKREQLDLILRYSNGSSLSEETLPRLLEKQ